MLTNSILVHLTQPDDAQEPQPECLLRPMFGTRRIEWPDDGSVEFHPSHSDWIRMFTAAGFEVLELHEPQAAPGLTSRHFPGGSEWATKWPVEEIWKVRKRG